ncbi:MAG: hypothetical protein AAGJ94_14765 [Pseudomonadota bacterium]
MRPTHAAHAPIEGKSSDDAVTPAPEDGFDYDRPFLVADTFSFDFDDGVAETTADAASGSGNAALVDSSDMSAVTLAGWFEALVDTPMACEGSRDVLNLGMSNANKLVDQALAALFGAELHVQNGTVDSTSSDVAGVTVETLDFG